MSEGAKIAKAAGIITICMVIARILGYVRDALLYAIFGQNRITDIYNAAFSIPDFIYMILIGGALSSAFIPVFGGYLARGEDEKGWQVANTMLNLLVILMITAITLGMLFTPNLIRLLVPGFNSSEIDMTVYLTRIMFSKPFYGFEWGIHGDPELL